MLSVLSRAALLVAALVPPAVAGGTQLVFDLSPFEPAGVAGEVLGLSGATGHVVHARLDATFVCAEPGDWSMSVQFALPTGLSGFDSQSLGWSGSGTFDVTLETDALNGPLAPAPGQTFWAWLVEWAGGKPVALPGGGVGLQPLDGSFTELRLTLTLGDDLPGPWVDAGQALAGVLGEPQLAASGNLCPGAPGALQLAGARPGAAAFLVLGLSSAWLPFHAGVLVPSPDVLLVQAVDRTGAASLPFVFPAGVPSGLSLWFQSWIPDAAGPAGFAASNALLAGVPWDC